MIAEMWRNHWERFLPFFAFAPEIRKIICTTNSIEAVNRQLRRISEVAQDRMRVRLHVPVEQSRSAEVVIVRQRVSSKSWSASRSSSAFASSVSDAELPLR